MTTLATQEAECQVFASVNGWEVVQVFIEDGKSAYKKNVKRPEFDRAMRMIETKQATVFLVWKLDRFYRSGTEFNAAWQRIDSAGGQFASVMESWIDTSTAMGRWQLSGVAYQAEIESENRSQRATSWNNGRLASEDGAGVPGGQRPYGYKRTTKGMIVPDPKEAKVVQEAAQRIINGESLKSVVRSMAPTSTRKSANGAAIPMSFRGMRHTLTNPTTFGLRRTPTGSLIKGCWEPVLPMALHAQLNAIFDAPERKHGRTNQVRHLLSGIIDCGNCGKKVGVRKWKSNAKSRNGNGLQKHRYTCECGNSIDEANADAVIMNRMWETVTPDVWESWKLMGHGWNPEVLDELNAQREQLDMMFLQGKFKNNPHRYEAMNAVIDAKQEAAMTNEPLDLPDVDDIEGSWESLSVVDQRKVIKQAFDYITLKPSNGTRNPIKRLEVK